LATHHASRSKVTCWSPKMISPGRQGRRSKAGAMRATHSCHPPNGRSHW
jgi:hypothetical protein